eukprot:4350007-Pleurochrysis_carterae.AAC.1
MAQSEEIALGWQCNKGVAAADEARRLVDAELCGWMSEGVQVAGVGEGGAGNAFGGADAYSPGGERFGGNGAKAMVGGREL